MTPQFLHDIEKRCADAVEYEKAERQFRGAMPMTETDMIRLISHIAIGLDNPFESTGFAGRDLSVVQKLSQERDQREARANSWAMVAGVLGHLPKEQVTLEANPLILGDACADSYLEQVRIDLPEVYPGTGQTMHASMLLLLSLLDHYSRDSLTDAERVAIGWSDIPKKVAA